MSSEPTAWIILTFAIINNLASENYAIALSFNGIKIGQNLRQQKILSLLQKFLLQIFVVEDIPTST